MPQKTTDSTDINALREALRDLPPFVNVAGLSRMANVTPNVLHRFISTGRTREAAAVARIEQAARDAGLLGHEARG